MNDKILWCSNAPWSTSGYGSQTSLFTPRIKELGYDVALSCFFGLEGGMHSWRDMLCYPTDATRFGGMLMSEYASHHGGGDPLNTLVITLQDVWPLMLHNPAYERLAELRMLSWTPVDHDPAPPMVIKFLKDTGPRVVALSRHGQAAFEKEGIDAAYVPHGFDPDIFKPQPDLRTEFREHLNIPQDAYVVGMVANNQGLPSRKAFPQVFQAFAKFAEKRKEAILYVHCDVFGRNNGVNLIRLAKACGIGPERMRTSEQLMLHLGIAQPLMAGVFNSFDVLCMPSLGEGFGIPLIEAQACFPASTPVEAEDVLAYHSKPYTGELFTITTERGSFEATADHPVWTTEGWRSAEAVQPGDQILYCHAPEGMEQVHRGTIGDVVQSLQDDAVARGGRVGRSFHERGFLPIAESWVDEEAILGDAPVASRDALRIRSLLLRRTGGWRRDGDGSARESWEGSERQPAAVLDHLQHGQATDRLANGQVPPTTSIRQSSHATGKHLLSLLARGAWLPASVRDAATEARDQGGHSRTGHRMDQREVVTITDGPLDDTAARDHLADPRSQYETVTSVTHRSVEDELVYNLVTASGAYRVGAGYLVHNCGVPVITTDWTAMTELCGAGWLVNGDKWWDESQAAWQKVPTVKGIHDALVQAYKSGGSQAKKAAAFAEQFQVDKVMELWKPVLAEACRPREVAPLKVAA